MLDNDKSSSQLGARTIGLSVIVVNYNNFHVLRNCLPSLRKALRTMSAEVIISDNGSTDQSPAWIQEWFPEFRLLKNGDNVGFAEANNRAFAVARGWFILLLNPDTVVLGNAIGAMSDFLEKKTEAGAVGCRLLNGDGSRQISARAFPTLVTFAMGLTGLAWRHPRSRLCARFEMTYWDGSTTRRVDWVSGAALMFRRDLLDRVGGLDPAFFLTYDEVDFCRRIKKAGYEIWYTPAGQIVHLDRQSEPQANPKPEARLKYLTVERNSRVRYFLKHHGVLYALCVEILHITMAACILAKVALFGTNQSTVSIMEKRLLLKLNLQTIRRLPRVLGHRLRRMFAPDVDQQPVPLFVNPYLGND